MAAPAATLSCASWREIKPFGRSVFKPRHPKTGSVRSGNIYKPLKFVNKSGGGSSPPDRAKRCFGQRWRGKLVTILSRQGSLRWGIYFLKDKDVKANLVKASGVLSRPKTQQLKLEMEIFGDISEYCLSNRAMDSRTLVHSVDELNTPVFDKALFDYDRQINNGLLDVVTSTADPFNIKIKNELSCIDNVNIEDNLMINENNVAFKEGESGDIFMPIDFATTMGEDVDNYIVIGSQDISTNHNTSEYEDIIYHNRSDKVTPIYEELINEDDEYLPTVNNCSDICLNNSLNTSNENSSSYIGDEYIILQAAPYETPDNSMSASDFSDVTSHTSYPVLTLNIDKQFKSTNIIDTPDVINTIDAIETEKDFNILSFITDEDIQTAAPALSALEIPSTSSNPTPPPPPPSYTLKKRTRKYDDDDDDEDYIPPTKKRSSTTTTVALAKQAVVAYDSNTSDDDDYEEKATVTNGKRRGRPPKRHVSASSEDCGTGKYREMRDKNNEASRKSRLKRKIKEMAQEGEVNQLEERNTKLKAQVDQLEKTVNNFRTNLMQILLSK